MQVGNVVRGTIISFNADPSDGVFPDKYLPAWGLIDSVEDDAVHVLPLSTFPDVEKSTYVPDCMCWDPAYDTFEVVPLDELPDEVCHVLMMRTLIGGEE